MMLQRGKDCGRGAAVVGAGWMRGGMGRRFDAILETWLEPDRLAQTPRTLAIAFAGGAVAALIGIPAPWLSGPAIATAIAAVQGVELGLPRLLREAALIFLGVSMGASVRPDTLELMLRFPLGLAGLALAVPLVMVGVAQYLARVHGFSAPTARLAAVPGALPFVLATSEATEADGRQVMIVQLVRLLAIAALLPTVVTLVGGHNAAPGVMPAPPRVDLIEDAIALAAGVAGMALFSRIGLPAPALFGSLVAAALLFGSGAVSSGFPAWMVLPGNLVVGAMTGASFSGADRSMLARTMPAALGAVVVGSLISLVCAVPVALAAGLPLMQVWLAYAPGAVETMAIVTLALGYDAAFVGAHHIARFFGLTILVPIWIRPYLVRRIGLGRD